MWHEPQLYVGRELAEAAWERAISGTLWDEVRTQRGALTDVAWRAAVAATPLARAAQALYADDPAVRAFSIGGRHGQHLL